jgi:parallel beta-helix repeat protein
MPQVEGLEIAGDHPEADGLEFIGVMQPTVHAVLIREVRHGIRLTRRNRNLLIDASHIYNCSGIGIFFDRVNLHQANIQGSHISYCKGGGIKIVGGEIRNLQITGNDIEYNYDLDAAQSADVWFDLRDGGSIAEGTIVSNTIQARPSPGGANIRFLGPEKPEERTRMGLWSITGNLIGSQTVNVHLKNSRGIVVTGNHIYSGQERTLVLEKSRHIVVGPNSLDQSHNFGRGFKNGVTVRDCDGVILNGLILDASQAGSEEEGGAIEIFDSRETTITGCQIFEPKFRGIYVSGSRNTLIADCMILDRTGKSPPLAAIEVDDTSLGAVIRGNIVERGE